MKIANLARPKSSYFRSLSTQETTKMNLFTAINDAMRIALKSDDTAIVFGEVIFCPVDFLY